MNDAETIVLRIRPLADDVPPEVRLRKALKLLLRAFNLRCIEVRPECEPNQTRPAVERAKKGSNQ